jgi:hypothetical protein
MRQSPRLRYVRRIGQVQSNYSLDAYSRYIAAESRPREPDLSILTALYERAIAEAARRRFQGEGGGEDVLRSFWTRYIDTQASDDVPISCAYNFELTPVRQSVNAVSDDMRLHAVRRAARSVPTSGEVWARYLRILVRLVTIF